MNDITEPGWTDAVDLGGDLAVLFYDDGTVRFRHPCDRRNRGPAWADADPDSAIIMCAPRLSLGHGHTIVTRDPLTIVASILCADCKTHGYVTESRWVPC